MHSSPTGEAREALAFWHGRLAHLPWYRRAARAEAREMVGRWRRRLVVAELERWRFGSLVAPVLTFVEIWSPRVLGRLLRATAVGRAVMVIAACAVVSTVALVALLGVVVAALLS